jgi:hypothetical protein
VLEETGYNLAGQINPGDVIEMSIKEQLISLFIVPGIPGDFSFKTRTRKEISVSANGSIKNPASNGITSELNGSN